MAESASNNRLARIEVAGDASEDEVAAISAALQLLWPEPVPLHPVPVDSPWRYSGRRWDTSKSSWSLSFRR